MELQVGDLQLVEGFVGDRDVDAAQALRQAFQVLLAHAPLCGRPYRTAFDVQGMRIYRAMVAAGG